MLDGVEQGKLSTIRDYGAYFLHPMWQELVDLYGDACVNRIDELKIESEHMVLCGQAPYNPPEFFFEAEWATAVHACAEDGPEREKTTKARERMASSVLFDNDRPYRPGDLFKTEDWRAALAAAQTKEDEILIGQLQLSCRA
ncbi:hypothetical protein CERZMDRAFT_89704 [Cercospora zeae-maydis SCOH1-5]|uniref:Uncharacterized protein n=1 Tax=Cercospora zeae-maydis SCOH1-5 TaxID=717836 RepID=A0A6A6FTT1_9PEZI|nr:hypothetical protein CERZMDRAFT_89704 [Cercospora zeae-maydis SCOH1-5]